MAARVSAMPVERIVDPACTGAHRRSPERVAEDTTHNAANHRTGRAGDHNAGSGTRYGAHHIGA